MYPFDYHRPDTVDEAVALLREREDATALAGGMTLIPAMKQRLAQPSDLVDLSGIAALHGIDDNDGQITINAMTSHADVAVAPDVLSRIPALAALAAQIGDAQVRNRGTLGGSIANSDPAADYPAAALALDATIVTDRREIEAREFFLGVFETALAKDELVVAVRFNTPQQAAYLKFPSPASRYAIVGVMVARFDDGVRVAVTGAGACAFRATAIETALDESFRADALASIVVDHTAFNRDLHATPEYRAHLVKVLVNRVVNNLK